MALRFLSLVLRGPGKEMAAPGALRLVSAAPAEMAGACEAGDVGGLRDRPGLFQASSVKEPHVGCAKEANIMFMQGCFQCPFLGPQRVAVLRKPTGRLGWVNQSALL